MKNEPKTIREELAEALKQEPDGDALLALWDTLPSGPSNLNAEALEADRARVLARLDSAEPRKATILRLGIALAAAAAVILIVMLQRSPETELFVGAKGASALRLPDGSAVTLSEGSSLVVKKEGWDDRRAVVLHGEALFEVAKNETPFVVETANATVTVTGTVFKVSSGPAAGTENAFFTNVMLASGSVNVADRTNTETLSPGESLEIMGQKRYRKTNDLSWLDDWQSGRIHFENERLAYIFSELQRQYKITIVYGRGVNPDEKLSYYRRKTSSADSVLQEIAALKNLLVTTKNDTFSISR
jgi:ferric-dicitrate binding protein FerR (iron transport regulator)